jgi:hypothetical protein
MPQSLPNTETAPSGVLTWRSTTERNKLLARWRLAICIAFGEQPRCLRVALAALDHLFNAKTGYAFPTNTRLAELTGLTPRNVQVALAALEQGGAIIRTGNSAPGRQGLRHIYPATDVLSVVGGTSTVDVGGYVYLPDVQNLRRIRHVPKTEMERARRARRSYASKAGPRSKSAISPRRRPMTSSRPRHVARKLGRPRVSP